MLPVMEPTALLFFLAIVGTAFKDAPDEVRNKLDNSDNLEASDYPVLNMQDCGFLSITHLASSGWIQNEGLDQYRLTPLGYKVFRSNFVSSTSDASKSAQRFYIELLQEGALEWNEWRRKNPKEDADLDSVDFTLPENFVSNFDGIEFGSASFCDTKFGDNSSFKSCKFFEHTYLCGARFGNNVVFDGTHFDEDAVFEPCFFGNQCSFKNVRFGRTLSFAKSTFGNDVNFENAKFGDYGTFCDCVFGNDANFRNVEFDMYANFDRSSFGNNANFVNARFGLCGRFSNVDFEDIAVFEGSNFGVDYLADMDIKL